MEPGKLVVSKIIVVLARQPEYELNQLFPDYAPVSLARLLLSVWDRGAEPLVTLIEHADMDHVSACSLAEQ